MASSRGSTTQRGGGEEEEGQPADVSVVCHSIHPSIHPSMCVCQACNAGELRGYVIHTAHHPYRWQARRQRERKCSPTYGCVSASCAELGNQTIHNGTHIMMRVKTAAAQGVSKTHGYTQPHAQHTCVGKERDESSRQTKRQPSIHPSSQSHVHSTEWCLSGVCYRRWVHAIFWGYVCVWVGVCGVQQQYLLLGCRCLGGGAMEARPG